MKIIIESIPHDKQRYSTVGDWYEEEGVIHIKISELHNWRNIALVAVHELVELLCCKHDGVSQQVVDDFDIEYEAKRKEGDESEPGDDPASPYMRQHCIATAVERLLAAELDVSWKEYEAELYKLP